MKKNGRISLLAGLKKRRSSGFVQFLVFRVAQGHKDRHFCKIGKISSHAYAIAEMGTARCKHFNTNLSNASMILCVWIKST
jgi:hypothetical protein